MKRYRWIGWLTAIILAFSLLAPAVGTALAEEGEDDFPPTEVATVVEEPVLDESQAEEPTEGEALPEETATVAPEETVGAAVLSETTEEELGEPVTLEEQEPDISGSVKVFFEDQYGDPIVGAGFALYVNVDGACSDTPIDSQLTDSNGIVIFLGIDPAATYCVVLESVPSGYENAVGWSWDVTPADTTDDLSPLDAVLYLGIAKLGGGELDAGKVTILKYYCEASGPEYQRVIFDLFNYDLDAVSAASESSLECAPGWAQFWIEPLGGDKGFFVETDAGTGSKVITGLPPGEYEITETAPWQSGTFVFEVFANGVATIAVQNFVYEGETGEGALEIQKYYCPGKSAWTEFVLDEVSAAHSECKRGQAEFVLFPYFAGEGISFETDHHGYILLEEVPEGTHLLMETGTEATLAVTIVDGQTTSLVVLNHFVPDDSDDGHHNPPVTDQDKESLVVEELPNTGTGSTPNESSLALVVGSLVALIAMAALRLRPWRHIC